MSEVRFEQLFSRYGKRAYVFKLTDTKEVARFRAKTKPQPSDYIICLDGEMFLAEVKESQNETSFPFGNIRTEQLAHARRLLAAGGKYFFFILQTRTGKWFCVPASVVLNCTKSSLKWSELQPYEWSRV